MRRLHLMPLLLVAATAAGSDHNNIERGRPLTFDDAYSIAYRELEWQNGIRFDTFTSQRPITNLTSELQYGFAKNKDISMSLEPVYDANKRTWTATLAELSYFENVRREIGNAPAFGYRIDLASAAGTGIDTRLRAVWTKTAHQYDRLHLNLDLSLQEGVLTAGAILGYTVPLGYPRHFDTTLLAELGTEDKRSWVGIGLRKQLSAVATLDIGIQSDLTGDQHSPARLTLGYGFSF